MVQPRGSMGSLGEAADLKDTNAVIARGIEAYIFLMRWLFQDGYKWFGRGRGDLEVLLLSPAWVCKARMQIAHHRWDGLSVLTSIMQVSRIRKSEG